MLVGDRLGLGQWFACSFRLPVWCCLFWGVAGPGRDAVPARRRDGSRQWLVVGFAASGDQAVGAGLNPYQVLFWQAVLSLPLFAAWSAFLESEAEYVLTGPIVAGVLYQGIVVAGLCFIILVFLLQHHSPGRLGGFGFATPVVGVLLSAALLDEAISPYLLASMGLVAVGIVVANWVERD